MNFRPTGYQKFKKWAVRMFGATAGTALAYIWLVIALLVLIVGIIIIVKLAQLIKRVLPDTTHKDVFRLMQEDGAGNYWWVYDNSGDSANIQSQAADSPPTTASFSLNYMMDSNGVAQVFVGLSTNDVTISEASAIDESNYTYRVTGEGQDMHVTYVDGVPHTESLSPTNTVTITYTNIVEISTNLADWNPIATNADVPIYTHENFVDTDPPATAKFYRIRALIPTNSVDGSTGDLEKQ